MKYHTVSLIVVAILCAAQAAVAQRRTRMSRSEMIDVVLQNTQPLAHPRGSRLPLYVWAAMGVGTDDEAEAEEIVRQLDERGIAVVASWNHNRFEQSLAEGLRIGAIQKRLGLRVNVNANTVLHRFCNGDPKTAHVTDSGEPFFDTSFGKNVQIGCPFALKFRYEEIRERVASFAREYRAKGVDVDFAFADWEIDGPIEWNGAWDAAKRCARCREHVPEIEDFTAFQRAYREIRSEMQREAYAEVLKSYFPDILVGNYAVYPHDGYRYWYDYFEEFVEGAPYKADQKAKHRQWAHEFSSTGYTFAMPVVYTWYPIFTWYDFQNTDYRWFYNMLRVASNAGANTPPGTPIITFVHWHTTSPPQNPVADLRQFSAETYQELLWHMLLRGHDTFFLWCPQNEIAEEVRLVHQVYAASLEFRDFLDNGEPVTFDMPEAEGPVVSALRLGDRLLVRRTDFADSPGLVALKVRGKTVQVPRVKRECQILAIDR